MDLGIRGKRALVTGSSAGIGFAIAAALRREGAHVVVNGRTVARVDEAVSRLERSGPGGRVDGIAADLGTREGALAIIRHTPEVDILVNNVGIFEAKPFEQISDEGWTQLFETNVMSGVRLSRHHLPGMKDRGWGRIVFISSESALNIPAEMIHYGMTKTAQLAVSRGLAETTAGTGVTVNAVLPGPTRSEGVARFVEELGRQQGKTPPEVEADFFRTLRPSSLLRRFATPDEVADLVAYVCSARAAATNGAALRVDGGVVRAIA